jgi:hypothetical protein
MPGQLFDPARFVRRDSKGRCAALRQSQLAKARGPNIIKNCPQNGLVLIHTATKDDEDAVGTYGEASEEILI